LKQTNKQSVLTPRELYEEMRSKGFNVEYRRVPITDEQAPKLKDVDEMVDAVKESPLDSRIVVNCQMGRGRTTTGLVVACTTRLWMRNALLDVPKALEVMKVRMHPPFLFLLLLLLLPVWMAVTNYISFVYKHVLLNCELALYFPFSMNM
jgi:protein-tyrosine phosphatase